MIMSISMAKETTKNTSEWIPSAPYETLSPFVALGYQGNASNITDQLLSSMEITSESHDYEMNATVTSDWFTTSSHKFDLNATVTSEWFKIASQEVEMNATATTDWYKTTSQLPENIQESYLSLVSKDIKMVCPPMLVIIGVIGNILTLLILGKKKNRRSQSIVFLLALAVSDILVLTTGNLSEWIRIMWKVDIRSSNGLVCKLHIFLTYFSIHFSSWILVLFTAERTISVLAPHKVRLWCNRSKERKSVFVLAIILACLNGHFLVGMVHKYNPYTLRYCAGISASYINFLNDVYTIVDVCVSFIVPAAFIITGNTIILIKLARRTGSQQKMTASASSKHPLTMILVLLNVMFILSMGPSAIYLVFLPSLIEKQTNLDLIFLIYDIVNLFAGLNAAINFILYILSGSRFRNEVKAIFCCRPAQGILTLSSTTRNISTATIRESSAAEKVTHVHVSTSSGDSEVFR